MESLTFFGVSVEYFGVFQRLWGPFVLISFRSYGGMLSNCSYTQKADENVAMQNKASPSLAAQFLKNYRETNHLTQVQLAEDLKGEPRPLRAWKDGVRNRRRSQRDESFR